MSYVQPLSPSWRHKRDYTISSWRSPNLQHDGTRCRRKDDEDGGTQWTLNGRDLALSIQQGESLRSKHFCAYGQQFRLEACPSANGSEVIIIVTTTGPCQRHGVDLKLAVEDHRGNSIPVTRVWRSRDVLPSGKGCVGGVVVAHKFMALDPPPEYDGSIVLQMMDTLVVSASVYIECTCHVAKLLEAPSLSAHLENVPCKAACTPLLPRPHGSGQHTSQTMSAAQQQALLEQAQLTPGQKALLRQAGVFIESFTMPCDEGILLASPPAMYGGFASEVSSLEASSVEIVDVTGIDKRPFYMRAASWCTSGIGSVASCTAVASIAAPLITYGVTAYVADVGTAFISRQAALVMRAAAAVAAQDAVGGTQLQHTTALILEQKAAVVDGKVAKGLALPKARFLLGGQSSEEITRLPQPPPSLTDSLAAVAGLWLGLGLRTTYILACQLPLAAVRAVAAVAYEQLCAVARLHLMVVHLTASLLVASTVALPGRACASLLGLVVRALNVLRRPAFAMLASAGRVARTKGASSGSAPRASILMWPVAAAAAVLRIMLGPVLFGLDWAVHGLTGLRRGAQGGYCQEPVPMSLLLASAAKRMASFAGDASGAVLVKVELVGTWGVSCMAAGLPALARQMLMAYVAFLFNMVRRVGEESAAMGSKLVAALWQHHVGEAVML